MATNPPEKKDPDSPPPPDKEEHSEIPKDKLTDVKYLVTYTTHLERRIKSLETEKQLLDTERLRLERELHSLQTELDRIRQPPLIEARLVKVLEDKRAVIQSSTGPRFVVNMSKKIKSSGLQAGQHVAINQRTYAIVEVIPLDEDEIQKGLTPVPLKLSTSSKDEERKDKPVE